MSFNKRYYSIDILILKARSSDLRTFTGYLLNPDAYIFQDKLSSSIHDLFSSAEESREAVWRILASQGDEKEPSLIVRALSKVWETVNSKENKEIHKEALHKFNSLFKDTDQSCRESLEIISNVIENKINKL